MSATSTLPPTSNSQEQSLAQYRSISKLSLVALGLGLASALALISLLLATINLAALAVAIVSLRGIRASGGQVVGRVPAILGLCLATFFLGWGVAARHTRALALETHARQFTEAWLRLVAARELQQADQLRLPSQSRIRSVAGRKEFYEKNPEALSNMTSFFANPALQDLSAQGHNVKIQFDAVVSSERSTYFDLVKLRYTFGSAENGAGRPLVVTIRRLLNEDNQTDWQIENAEGEPGS